jgi:hypothetical protein
VKIMASRKPSLPRVPVATKTHQRTQTPAAADGPTRRETMEVEASWLEQVDEVAAAPRKPSKPPADGPTRRETMDVHLDWLEPDDAPDPGRPRAAWEPPPLPPPPATAMRPRRVLPPPLPREDEPTPEKRRTKRPPRG